MFIMISILNLGIIYLVAYLFKGNPHEEAGSAKCKAALELLEFSHCGYKYDFIEIQRVLTRRRSMSGTAPYASVNEQSLTRYRGEISHHKSTTN